MTVQKEEQALEILKSAKKFRDTSEVDYMLDNTDIIMELTRNLNIDWDEAEEFFDNNYKDNK
jgi:hypothetical protein